MDDDKHQGITKAHMSTQCSMSYKVRNKKDRNHCAQIHRLFQNKIHHKTRFAHT